MASSLGINSSTNVLIITGAGVSAESGVPTFRDAGGLWMGHNIEDVASPAGFDENPDLVWKFYSERRKGVIAARPNAAHRAIAALEPMLTDNFLLVTQNVDDLHERAGSKNIVKLHGDLLRTRCSNGLCDNFHSAPSTLMPSSAPRCPKCGCHERPDVVWFGEGLSDDSCDRVFRFIKQARDSMSRFLCIVVGTSGVVYPASSYAGIAKAAGAETVLVNLEVTDQVDDFDRFYCGKATDILPGLIVWHSF